MNQGLNGDLVPIGGGDPIPLIRPVLTVGRRESCDICLRFPNISGMHCELNYKEGCWHIRDLGSTNGIKVNGVRVQKKILMPGDEVTIAKRRYRINYAPPIGSRILADVQDDIMSQSLLERAGLERPREQDEDSSRDDVDPAEFLTRDDEKQ